MKSDETNIIRLPYYETEEDRMIKYRQQDPGEPEVCKAFGCGNHLTLQERLHGKYCIHHQWLNDKSAWKRF